MKNLGFNGKSYTLWEITSTDTDNGLYTKRFTTYKYIKALSKDLTKAIELAGDPTIMVNDECRTNKRSTFYRVEHLNFRTDRFIWGKYAGKTFEEVKDTDYLVWFYDNCDNKEVCRNIKTELIARGFTFIGRSHFTDEELQAKVAFNEDHNEFLEDIKNNREFYVNMEKNINEDGIYTDKHCTLKFNNFSRNYYAGYYYVLPRDAKGKAKRVKGKTIIIKSYEAEIDEMTGKVTVNVSDFKIKKI